MENVRQAIEVEQRKLRDMVEEDEATALELEAQEARIAVLQTRIGLQLTRARTGGLTEMTWTERTDSAASAFRGNKGSRLGPRPARG